MKINFKNTEDLRRAIDETYFGENEQGTYNNGVLPKEPVDLKISKDDIYYKILTGLDYDVKLRNQIIEGSLTCCISAEDDNNIFLKPISRFCVQQDGVYSFY